MVEEKPSTPPTHVEAGRAEGIGLGFLEQTPNPATAPRQHPFHRKAAQDVLKALRSNIGAGIKVQGRWRQELLEASAHANRPGNFEDSTHFLDPEFRPITPADAEGPSGEVHLIPRRLWNTCFNSAWIWACSTPSVRPLKINA
jgi:eukaryotic-like serine/threonine-protein kinase